MTGGTPALPWGWPLLPALPFGLRIAPSGRQFACPPCGLSFAVYPPRNARRLGTMVPPRTLHRSSSHFPSAVPVRVSEPKPPLLPPRVFHLAEAVNWPSIQEHGLLSTRRLVERAGLDPNLLSRHRPRSVTLTDGTLIRDQAPMPPAALARCLAGELTPGEWYALLNARVFFWCDPARLERQRRACAPRSQVVLIIDTARLLARYGDRTSLTPINTGYALRQAAQRGATTFVPYHEWLRSSWASEAVGLALDKVRVRTHPPAELTVTDAVPDAMDLVVAVHRR